MYLFQSPAQTVVGTRHSATRVYIRWAVRGGNSRYFASFPKINLLPLHACQQYPTSILYRRGYSHQAKIEGITQSYCCKVTNSSKGRTSTVPYDTYTSKHLYLHQHQLMTVHLHGNSGWIRLCIQRCPHSSGYIPIQLLPYMTIQ